MPGLGLPRPMVRLARVVRINGNLLYSGFQFIRLSISVTVNRKELFPSLYGIRAAHTRRPVIALHFNVVPEAGSIAHHPRNAIIPRVLRASDVIAALG